jgi:hypothetical protein
MPPIPPPPPPPPPGAPPPAPPAPLSSPPLAASRADVSPALAQAAAKTQSESKQRYRMIREYSAQTEQRLSHLRDNVGVSSATHGFGLIGEQLI